MNRKRFNVSLLLFSGACFVLTVLALFSYPGRWYVYLLFSLLLNILLFLGVRKDSLFFDLFIGGLFWLGYWLKFSVRVAFMDGQFVEDVGSFDYSGNDFDHALLVVACGVFGLLLARLVRARYWFTYPKQDSKLGLDGLRAIYERQRIPIWIAFVALILAVTVSNYSLGIYQRGLASRTVLPYGLNGVYTWLLLFGAATISALMLGFEVKTRRAVPFALILVVLLEAFASNVSMLSRGMILNAGVLMIGTFVATQREGVYLRRSIVSVTFVAIAVLFALSVLIVNHVRLGEYYSPYLDRIDGGEGAGISASPSAEKLMSYTTILVLDRWVGIEGAMAVSSYPNLGWDLFGEAWREQYVDRGSSMYDLRIAKSVTEADQAFMVKHGQHFISIPGILSFFYYPGSYLFLIAAMFFVGAAAAGIEAATYKFTGFNIILCSLIAFTVAYRYMHFGYVPSRSYLLFGTIAANIALIYCIDRFLARGSTNRQLN